MLPGLVARLAVGAPNVDLWVVSAGVEDVYQLLVSGGVDDVIGIPRRGEPLAAIRVRRLFEERFVVIGRAGHPALAGGTLSLDDYTALPHAFVAPRGSPGGVVDDALEGLGRSRRVAVAVPHFLVVPHLVGASDLIATMGERLARTYAALMPLAVVEPPLPLPRFSNVLRWHDRWHHDPGHAWLRGLLAEAADAT